MHKLKITMKMELSIPGMSTQDKNGKTRSWHLVDDDEDGIH